MSFKVIRGKTTSHISQLFLGILIFWVSHVLVPSLTVSLSWRVLQAKWRPCCLWNGFRYHNAGLEPQLLVIVFCCFAFRMPQWHWKIAWLMVWTCFKCFFWVWWIILYTEPNYPNWRWGASRPVSGDGSENTTSLGLGALGVPMAVAVGNGPRLNLLKSEMLWINAPLCWLWLKVVAVLHNFLPCQRWCHHSAEVEYGHRRSIHSACWGRNADYR